MITLLRNPAFIVTVILFTGVVSHANGSEYSCGEKALFTAFQGIGTETKLADIAQAVHAVGSLPPDSIGALATAVEKLNCFGAIVRLSPCDSSIDRVPLCSVMHLNAIDSTHEAHFVTFLGRSRDGSIVLADFPLPPYQMSSAEFLSRWSGHALAVFTQKNDRDNYVRSLRFDNAMLLGGAATTVIVLFLLLQVARSQWFRCARLFIAPYRCS